MTTMLSLILALMLTMGGSPAVSISPVNSIGPESGVSKDITGKPGLGEFLKIYPVGAKPNAGNPRLVLNLSFQYKKSPLINLNQAFGMNPVNFTDPFGKDVLGSCSSSYQHFLKPSENEEIIKKQFRSYALVGEGIANAATKAFLIPAKFITLPARLMFGFDFDVNVNFTEEGSVIGGYLGKEDRLNIVKEQTIVFPLADFVTQTSHDVYFGLFYQGGNSILLSSIYYSGETLIQELKPKPQEFRQIFLLSMTQSLLLNNFLEKI
jgi:hypothetical protein